MSKADEHELHCDRRRLDWFSRVDELRGKEKLGELVAPDITPAVKLRGVAKMLEDGSGRTLRQTIDEAMRRWP